MKKTLLLSSLIFVFISLVFSISVKAQSDTNVYDYDSYTGCNACGDAIMITSTGTKDSLTDATPSTHFLSSLKVKIKLFTCFTGTLNLTLNGNVVATVSSPYNCACNACDSLVFNISASNINAYYKLGQKNVFRLVPSSSASLYIDRTIIYRTRSKKSNYDAGILSVDSPMVYVCPGSKNIKVKINNGGKKQFTGVGIDWKWNGVNQTGVSYSGTLDTLNGSGSNTALVLLGSKTFTKGKKDTLMAWTKNPGGVPDSTTYNDTVRFIFNGSYGDTIRIGGTSPHFSTIQGAVNALMSNGVCAPVFIKLWPGTYNEQVSIGPIPGTNSTNTVTFLSRNNDSSGVVINYSGSSSQNYTVRLNNTKFISFKRVTIEALNSTYGVVVSMTGDLENISFNNCALLGVYTTSTSTNQCVVYRTYNQPTDKTKNISFTQSRLNQGSYGMYFYNSYNNYADGFYLRNNVFENQYYSNLYFYYGKNIGISNNIFERNTSSLYYGYGLIFQYTEDSMTIVSNRIFQKNGGIAFYCYDCTGKSSKRNLIANNFISSF